MNSIEIASASPVTTPARRRRALSPVPVGAAAVAFAAGLGTGVYHYVTRSPIVEKHSADTAAWTQHAIIAAVAAVLLAGAYVLRRRHGRGGEPVLLAPFGRHGVDRLAATWRRPSRRALVSVPLLAVGSYTFWRAGEQITGGLDPNFTANAWGGPSYLGALVCHYLDGALMFAAASLVLSRVLLRTRSGSR